MGFRRFSAAVGAVAVLMGLLVTVPASAVPKDSPAPPPNTYVEVNCLTDIYNSLGDTYLTGGHPEDQWLGPELYGVQYVTRPVGFGDTRIWHGDNYSDVKVILGEPPSWRDAGEAVILCKWDTNEFRGAPYNAAGTVWLTIDTMYKANIAQDKVIDVVCGDVAGKYIPPKNFTDRWKPVDLSLPSLTPVNFGERRARFVWDDPNAEYGPVQDFSLVPAFGPKNNGSLKKAVDCSYSIVTYTSSYRGVVGTVYGTFKAQLKQ